MRENFNVIKKTIGCGKYVQKKNYREPWPSVLTNLSKLRKQAIAMVTINATTEYAIHIK